MASGGSSGQAGSGSRSFDFGTDDVLCSYDDLLNQDTANGSRSDSSGKDLRENRAGRPRANVYSQQEGYNKQDVIFAVEKCMKKYADNLLSFLEGISGRLSQLEVYCYNLERSIGELRSDLAHDQKESDSKLKSLEKHLQEVHRSAQILRDKQELADTQKELAKLQLVQKESSDGHAPPSSEPKKHDDAPDSANQQLALALPQQALPQVQQPAPPSLNVQQAPYVLNQGGTFYPQQTQMLNQPPQLQQNPTLQPEPRYVPQRPQPQDLSGQPPQQQHHVVNQSQTPPSFTHYQQQWPQQTSQPFPQHVVQQQQQQQQGTSQAQFQPETPPAYPSYPSHLPAKSGPETFPVPGSISLAATYSMTPQSGGRRPEALPFGYGGPGSTVQQPPPPPTHNIPRQTQPQAQTGQSPSGPQLNTSGYMSGSPYPPQSTVQGYMVYGSDGSRAGHSQPFPPGSYAPAIQNQQLPPGSLVPHHPGLQPIRNHPYGELLEKAVNMGYGRDQVASAIYRMEESGQPIDFNALLDVLNSRPSGATQRGWSG